MKTKIMCLITISMLCCSLAGCNFTQEEKVTNKAGKVIDVGDINTYSVLKDVDFESSIPTETDRVKKSLEIDAQIQKLLNDKTYTFKTLDASNIIVNAYGNSPLTALALFVTDEKCSVTVTVKGKTDATDITSSVDKPTKSHRVPIVGLYPATDNTVTIQLLDENKKEIDAKTFIIKTDPLPTTLSNSLKVYKHTKTSAFKLTEVSGFQTPYIYSFDENGDIRWFLNEKYGCYGYFPLSNGHFMWMDGDDMNITPEKPHSQNMYETDYLGRVYQIYYVKNGLHHEIIEKEEGGNLLVATSSLEDGHFEETLQEISRTTGQAVKTVYMKDIYGEDAVREGDWAHINTISYYKEDDSLVVSTRNVHTVVKFNWTTGDIIWTFGHPSVWSGSSVASHCLKATGDNFDWQFQQHASYVLDRDLDNNPETIELMMFDNHWDDDAPIDALTPTKESFVRIYSINEKEGTTSLLKEYKSAKSRITSNWQADFDAGRVFSMNGYIKWREENDGMHGMFYEYDYETEKLLNQWGTIYTYYRGYRMDIDINSCSSALKSQVRDNYFCGELNQPEDAKELAKKAENKQETSEQEATIAAKAKDVTIPTKKLKASKASYSILGNILKINAYDHSIKKVEFVGNRNYYIFDYNYAGKGLKKFKKLSYNLSLSFQNMKPDNYKIIITYKKKRYDSGQTLSIKR